MSTFDLAFAGLDSRGIGDFPKENSHAKADIALNVLPTVSNLFIVSMLGSVQSFRATNQ